MNTVFVSVRSSLAHGTDVWFSLLSPSLAVYRERRHPPITALTQELLVPEKRPGPCSEAETPSTVLMTKISQEGETSPGAAPKRHLNDAYTQDLSAKNDGHFISWTHWQFCNGQVMKTACGHTVCFLSSLAGKAMSMEHMSFSSSFWEFSSYWLQPFQTIHLICLMPSW